MLQGRHNSIFNVQQTKENQNQSPVTISVLRLLLVYVILRDPLAGQINPP